MKDFIHLRLHSEFPPIDGGVPINKELINLARKYNMQAMGLTDVGTVKGCYDFDNLLNCNAIKPILGCEIIHEEDEFRLPLIAKDKKGFENLCKLSKIAPEELDINIIEKYSADLIAFSGCSYGKIPRSILAGDINRTKKIIDKYLSIFGRHYFYLELMDHGLAVEKLINKTLIELSKELNVKLVATNKANHLNKKNAESFNKFQHNTPELIAGEEYYLKSPEEMHGIFKEVPDALKNTMEVAEMSNVVICSGMLAEMVGKDLSVEYRAGLRKNSFTFIRGGSMLQDLVDKGWLKVNELEVCKFPGISKDINTIESINGKIRLGCLGNGEIYFWSGDVFHVLAAKALGFIWDLALVYTPHSDTIALSRGYNITVEGFINLVNTDKEIKLILKQLKKFIPKIKYLDIGGLKKEFKEFI